MTVSISPARKLGRVVLAAFALSAAFAVRAAPADETALPTPEILIVDHSLPPGQVTAEVLAARNFYAFWSSGQRRYLDAAISPQFVDRTPPKDRPAGPDGPLAASRTFLSAVPDLKLEVRQLIVAGDRVVAHLHFTGHFTGQFLGKAGTGQPVDFIATDILKIGAGRITDNWHLEDNLTFLQQLGAIPTN